MSRSIAKGNLPYSLLYSHILLFEKNRLDAEIKELSNRNIAKGANNTSMLLNGKIIAPNSWYKGAKAQPISKELEEEAYQISEKLNKFAKERDFIRHACSLLFPNILDPSYLEIRNSFNDIVVNQIPILQGIKRTEPEMYLVLHKPSVIKQWEKANYLLEYYIGNRLIFG